MKHLKLFEIYTGKMNFWKIKTDEPYFSASLNKLGVADDSIFRDDFNYSRIKKYDYVYITYHISPGKLTGGWTWNAEPFDIDSYSRFNYIGELELTPEDIEKQRLIFDTKKYNL